jgi:hypothetical protein
MQRFIKKNLFLVGVIGISALGILVLLVLSAIQYFAMSSAIERTEELRKANDKLMGFQVMPDGSRRPPRPDFIPPVKENEDLMQIDIDGYSEKEVALRKYFGQPLYPALKVFCNKLTELEKAGKKGKKAKAAVDFTPEKMYEHFKTFWEAEKESNSDNRKNICRNFVKWGIKEKLWKADNWNEAMNGFVKEAQKSTEEKIDANNFEDIFLTSIGVSRDMSDSDLELFKNRMQKRVIEMFKENKNAPIDVKWINFHEQLAIEPLRTNEDFQDNFDREQSKETAERRSESSSSPAGGMSDTAKPGDDKEKDGPTVADEVRHWEIICDLSRRICQSKLKNLERLAFADLTGRKNDDENKKCRFYTYTLTVSGNEQSVRNFMNLLNEAYKDHRVYVVRNMSIAKQEDQVQDVIDADKINARRTAKADNTMSSNEVVAMVPAGGGDLESGSRQVVIDEFEDEYFIEKGEAQECVAGRSQLVTVTFTLDYVVYDNTIDLKK